MTILDSSLHLCIGYRCILKSWCRMGLTVVKPPTAEFVSTEWYLIRGHEDHRGSMHLRPVQTTVMSGESWLRRGMTCYWQVLGYLFCGGDVLIGHRICNFTQTNIVITRSSVPQHDLGSSVPVEYSHVWNESTMKIQKRSGSRKLYQYVRVGLHDRNVIGVPDSGWIRTSRI